jgi:hypothetical protein
MRSALGVLASIPAAALDDDQRRQRECIVKRFASGERELARNDPAHPVLSAAIAAYHAYWTRTLLKQLDESAGESFLRQELQTIVASDEDRDVAHAVSMDDLQDRLGAKLQAEGLHSIRGITRPYYELMVWRTETPKTYEVTLPEGPATVNVVLLRDFEVLGWSAFATCEHKHTGGWAEKDKLYCVADSYDLSSEKFSVSYLAHEAQHFADYKRFPQLAGPELEYRAKLVELMQSKQTTRELVHLFATQTGQSRDAPHSFANAVLMRDLARVLGLDEKDAASPATAEDAAIRSSAATLYRANTEQLMARGASTVTQVLAL